MGSLQEEGKKVGLNLHNKKNQHGSLKALRQKRATLLTPCYLRRYIY